MATPSWLYISQLTGNSGTTRITVSADTNYNFYSLITDVFVETDNTGLQGDTVIVQKASGDTNHNYVNDYLTFEIISNGTIYWMCGTYKEFKKTIRYSKDNGATWKVMTASSGQSAIQVSRGDKVLFKGDNTNYSYGNDTYVNRFVVENAKFNLYGNIMSLVNSTGFSATTTITRGDTFWKMFYQQSGLISAKNLILPATTLASGCYSKMFEGCTSLRNIPELPATRLATHCYEGMFSGCISLKFVPSDYLPATASAGGCYAYMFNGCTNLTTAPELPATTLTSYCYNKMFAGCTSLTTAPELPATEVIEAYSYQGMFSGCTSLTTAPPKLGNTFHTDGYTVPKLNYGCASMFEGCTSLVTVPELPALTLGEHCYKSMFQGCTSLTTAPELPATTLTGGCYENMFYNCTSLVNIPSVLPATTLAEYCYKSMFQGCTSLTTAPELPAPSLVSYCYAMMFYHCYSLNYIKCLATSGINQNSSTSSWVALVASSGTFVKKTGVYWPNSAIPYYWTVEEV